MYYKPDWDEAKAHLTAWWRFGSIDRAALAVTAPKPVDLPPLVPPKDMTARWLDPDWRIAQAERRFETTHFLGESFPWLDTNIGPGSLANYLGSEPVFAPDTVWYAPVASRPADVPPLRFDPENRWWLANLRLVQEGMRRADGRYLVSFPDLIENLDIVSALLGPQETLYAMKDDPEGVKRLVREVNELYFRYYDELYAVLDGPRLGSCFSAFQIWCAGRVAKLQCDASAMISARTFDEFVAPALAEQLRHLDCAAYHLDGTHATHHLAALLALDGLNVIQWTPGAGQPGTGDECWWPMYREVLAKGKGLLLLGVRFDEVGSLARHLGRDGVYIGTHAPTMEAGRDLLRRARNW